MNDPMEYLDKLAHRARQEVVPQGDVSLRVLPRLHQRAVSLRSPMLVFATGYAAVASVAMVYGYMLMGSMSDPLLSVFHQAAVVMP